MKILLDDKGKKPKKKVAPPPDAPSKWPDTPPVLPPPPGGAYDPRSAGADCDACPMRRWHGSAWKPVRAQTVLLPVDPRTKQRPAPLAVFIGQSPGIEEVRRGAPYVGEAGGVLNEALKEAGIDRRSLVIDNTIQCLPPGMVTREGKQVDKTQGKYELIEVRLRREREWGISPPWEQHPAVHCRRRLLVTLGQSNNVVAMGGPAAEAILDTNASISSIRGGPKTADVAVPPAPGTANPNPARQIIRTVQKRVMPTLEPAAVARERRHLRLLTGDLRRAVRLFTDTLTWRDPAVIYDPTPDELWDFLYTHPDGALARWWTYDVESERNGPIKSKTWTIQIARDRGDIGDGRYPDDPKLLKNKGMPRTPDVAVVYLHDIEKGTDRHDAAVTEASKDICRLAFTDGRWWSGHNAGYFDRMNMESNLGVTPGLPWKDHAATMQKWGIPVDGPLLRASKGTMWPPEWIEAESWPTPKPVTIYKRKDGKATKEVVKVLHLPKERRHLPPRLADTIIHHALAWSEMRHGLGETGTVYTDITSWKQDNEGVKIATGARSNAELGEYGAKDAAVTFVQAPAIYVEGAMFDQIGPTAACPGRPSITLDALLGRIHTDVCPGMHRTGLFIDQKAREAVEVELAAKEEARREAAAIAADALGWSRGMFKGKTPPPFNPGSVDHCKRLLFDLCKLDPVEPTDSGDPSTGDLTMRTHLMDKAVTPLVKAALRAIRNYRETQKQRGMLRPLRPRLLDPEDGAVDEDGRLRTNWHAFRTVTTRLASSDPLNLQNWPKWMRKLVRAAPGHILVGADEDAIEGRLASAHWRLTTYIEAFANGLDVHQITMELALGARIWNAPGAPPPHARYKKEWVNPDGSVGEIGGKFDELRTLCKRYFYAKIYGAMDDTVLSILQEVEIEEAEWRKTAPTGAVFTDRDAFPYADYDEATIAAMSKRFLAGLPQLPAGWKAEEKFTAANGFNYDRITGRRRRFLNGLEPNEVRNFPIQAGAAGIVNLATVDLVDYLPFGFGGAGTGLLQQGHDALLVECLEQDADEVCDIVTGCMTSEFPTIYPGMLFKAKAKKGMTWKEVA